MMPSSIKKVFSFFKVWNFAENLFIVFFCNVKQLKQDISHVKLFSSPKNKTENLYL